MASIEYRAACGQITDAYHDEWFLWEIISALFRAVFPFLLILPSTAAASSQMSTTQARVVQMQGNG